MTYLAKVEEHGYEAEAVEFNTSDEAKAFIIEEINWLIEHNGDAPKFVDSLKDALPRVKSFDDEDHLVINHMVPGVPSFRFLIVKK